MHPLLNKMFNKMRSPLLLKMRQFLMSLLMSGSLMKRLALGPCVIIGPDLSYLCLPVMTVFLNADDLISKRESVMKQEDGQTVVRIDDWRNDKQATLDTGANWTGKSIFTLRPEQALVPVAVADADGEKQLTIEGIVVTEQSPINTLRAACARCGVSQSGGKKKLFTRLESQSYFDKQQLLAAKTAADQVLQEGSRQPEMVAVHPPPNADEIAKHQLTHLPYQPWCSACVKAKGRAPRHEQDVEHKLRKETPTVSADLCFTGFGDSDEHKLIALVMIDSSNGLMQAVPIDAKANIMYMAKEVVRSMKFSSHGKVHFGMNPMITRNDQEPTMLKLQQTVQNIRSKLGFKTLIENPHIKDHAHNSLVEGAIHRLRQTACVLIHNFEERTGLKLHADHALTSWAFVHASWLETRFTVRGNQTTYEVIMGHRYEGKLAEWGEPIMLCVADEAGPKGRAKWQEGIYLSKAATNDMFICGVGEQIRLQKDSAGLEQRFETVCRFQGSFLES